MAPARDLHAAHDLPSLRGRVRVVLLDLDGTVYEGSRVVPGAAAAIRRLRAHGLTVRFLTNTDSRTPKELTERLAGMGVQAEADELITPVAVAGQLFDQTPGCRVLALASESVRALLGRHLAAPGERPTHVLVADPSFGAAYADLDAAFRAVRAGAELVATQVGRIARRDDGEHLDTGGFVRLLEYAAGVTARILGKPSPEVVAVPLRALGQPPAAALVVGDDPTSDLAVAAAAGAPAILVRTGKGATTTTSIPPEGTPDGAPAPVAVLDSLADLPGVLGVPRD